jgi:hypothetical protein
MPPSTGTRRRKRPGASVSDRAAVRAGAPPGDEGRVRRVPGGDRLEAAARGALARGGPPAGVQRARAGRRGLPGVAARADRSALPAADRGGVGVRGPRGHPHRIRVRRFGGLPGRALQLAVPLRGAARAAPLVPAAVHPDAPAAGCRQLSAEPLGPARHARQRAGVHRHPPGATATPTCRAMACTDAWGTRSGWWSRAAPGSIPPWPAAAPPAAAGTSSRWTPTSASGCSGSFDVRAPT